TASDRTTSLRWRCERLPYYAASVTSTVHRARDAVFLLFAALLTPLPAAAHQFAPALLEIQEVAAGRARGRWKQPAVRWQESQLGPVLPGGCASISQPSIALEDAGMLDRWEMLCPGGVVGKTLGVEGLDTSGTDVLLRVALTDGRSFRHVLTA